MSRSENKIQTKGSTRRDFIKTAGLTVLSAVAFPGLSGCSRTETVSNADSAFRKPNIILVLTDDQGYGDLGIHGNPSIKIPHIDAFAKESVEFTNFYANPMCTPTRASLLTGRYYYRTGVTDTYLGRAMMRSNEVTIAEMLRECGFKTAIFGKWHLGDNYPMRPVDQGFDESLVFRGGGIGQPADPPGNNYFNPVLEHNGKAERTQGYCMDVFTDAAIDFIEKNKDCPFFVYLPTNTPHSPLEVNDSYADPYRKMGLTEKTSQVYGMMTNIDDNFGRLLAKLKNLGLAENTIVIFMSDNGPCPSSIDKDRFMGGLRGQKATVYENGIRVPFLIRWPGSFKAGQTIDRIASVIDVMPTLRNACRLNLPQADVIDGTDLTPLLNGTCKSWPDRTLYFQWHRGDLPELNRCFAVRNQRYKLVQAQGWTGEGDESQFKFELFDMSVDPGETNDLADQYPKIVTEMKRNYIQWFKDVTRGCGDFPDIYIGTSHENPTILTRQDWRGAEGWDDTDVGYWKIRVMTAGIYSFNVRFSMPAPSAGKVCLQAGGRNLTLAMNAGADTVDFGPVELPKGRCRIKAWMEMPTIVTGARYVMVNHLAGD
jgi:arylsulfatase A-like enzyme